jgi:hypothetical protein
LNVTKAGISTSQTDLDVRRRFSALQISQIEIDGNAKTSMSKLRRTILWIVSEFLA